MMTHIPWLASVPPAALCLPKDYIKATKRAHLDSARRTVRWWRGGTNTHQTVRAEAKPGRNEPRHCGSGKEYKRCHGA